MARLLTSAPPTDRTGRYPKHTFNIRELPFTATPFCIARVLPGETLQNLFFESRVITDPILNPIIGWKKQYFYFYVKASDLMLDVFKDMFVDPANAELAGHDEAANITRTYAAKGGVDWVGKCLDRVVLMHFRDEGEAVGDYVTAGGDRIVQLRETPGFLDTLMAQSDMPEGDAIAGATDAGDLERLMMAFENLRAMGIADMTYEDFLRQYGINVPDVMEGKPELLATFSEFQYPSNTIDPETGAPSSACSWVFKNGERRPKQFKEPGFVIGVSVTRPKVYFSGLAGYVGGFAQRAWDWMPYYAQMMPETAFKFFAADTGPLGDRTAATTAYLLDMRDELLYGDQYQNHTAFNVVPATDGANHMLALPESDLDYKYPTEAMCKCFFVDAAGTAFHVRQDGYVSFNIKSSANAPIVDYTVGNFAEQ